MNELFQFQTTAFVINEAKSGSHKGEEETPHTCEMYLFYLENVLNSRLEREAVAEDKQTDV